MKIIEIRLHTLKDKNDEVTPEGKALAVKIGKEINLNNYQLFIIGPTKRCRETMIYFGVSEKLIKEDRRFDALPQKKINAYHQKGELIEKVGDFFQIPELKNFLKSIGKRVIKAIEETAQKLPEGGQALIVSHGGTIIPAAHLIRKIDFENFKKLPECGGIKFILKGDKITDYEIIIPS